jgi:Ca-activated chloride channel homolog
LKRFVYIAVFLFYPLLAFSQNYMKGQVKDEAGSPLPNATVYLHSNGYTYYSRSDGAFGVLSNLKVDTITVFLEGYQQQKLVIDDDGFLMIRLKRAPLVKTARNRLSSLTLNLKRETQQQWFTGEETYASIIENQFINSTAYPATTVTLNVDRASYSNIRRFLTLNSIVPPDAVRIEEMLNYFNFDYTPPSDNKTFDIKTVVTQCPWNKDNHLLFAQIKSKKLSLDSLPPSHLVFLIDVSGSMDMPNRLPLLKSGFKALVNNLREKDSVSIIVYGGVVGIALPTTGGDEKDKILKTIDSLQPGGSTPGASGIKLAYSVARNHFIKNGNNRVILATDGDFNVGLKTEDELEEMISVQRESGIYLTCLGVGMGNYKDSKIQTLAQRGNGNFAYIDNYAEAEKVLLKEFAQTLFIVADDAWLNVQMDPDYVKEYRVLGFNNKVGALKDNDAVVEGGEISSGYSILVAYEIVPAQGSISAEETGFPYKPVSFSLHYKLPFDTTRRNFTCSPEVSFTLYEELDRPYQFASTVIMFGSMLRKSKFVREISWNELLRLATLSANLNDYSQKEFLTLIQLAKNVYGKKKKKDKDREQ